MKIKVYICVANLLIWGNWIQVRRSLPISNSVVSAAIVTDELVNIVESCNL